MKYLITFLIYFLIIYVIYYFCIYKVQKKKKYRKKTTDLYILQNYYNLDVKSIGYKKVYRYLNITNALLISFITLMVINIENFLMKIIIVTVITIPVILFGYFVLTKILERKVNKNV